MTENISTEETLTDRANRLAREAVKHVMSYHNPYQEKPESGRVLCSHDDAEWPCDVVNDLSEAEEAISAAEEAEERTAGGPYYCTAIIRPARLYGDAPEPEELCGNEVDSDGEPCAEHDEHNDEDEKYERWREERLGL